MKKIIAIIMILSLLLLIGCSKNTPTSDSKDITVKDTSSVQGSNEQNEEVSSDLSELDSLNNDLDFSDLDSLDSDLDLEI